MKYVQQCPCGFTWSTELPDVTAMNRGHCKGLPLFCFKAGDELLVAEQRELFA